MSLGEQLSRLRQAARMPLDLAASSLGWTPDVLRAIESGEKHDVSVAEVRGMLALYRFTKPELINRFVGVCPKCSDDEGTMIVLCFTCRAVPHPALPDDAPKAARK